MDIVSSKRGVSDEGDSNHEQCYVVRSLCVINLTLSLHSHDFSFLIFTEF